MFSERKYRLNLKRKPILLEADFAAETPRERSDPRGTPNIDHLSQRH